ncbi:MAG: hypothetical protein VB980_07465, partial [Opitutales bacterium]
MTKHRFHFFVSFILAAFFAGCGDDPNIETPDANIAVDDGNQSPPPANATFVASGNPDTPSSPVDPEVTVPAPPVPATVTEEKTDVEVKPDYSTGENEEALDFPRLLAKADDTAYTGPFTRVSPNGKREFSAN